MNYYLGEIITFAGPYVPQNFQVCDGSALSISTYEALYSLIGTSYGGDGVNTFKVPKLQGIVAVGTGKSLVGTQYPLASTGGVPTVTVLEAQLPTHAHPLNATTANATTGVPTDALLAASNSPQGYPNAFAYSQAPASKPAVTGLLNSLSVSQMGSNQPHDNMMPYLTINYMICTNGEYPSPS
jgi:microcystin-dependent protein